MNSKLTAKETFKIFSTIGQGAVKVLRENGHEVSLNRVQINENKIVIEVKS